MQGVVSTELTGNRGLRDIDTPEIDPKQCPRPLSVLDCQAYGQVYSSWDVDLVRLASNLNRKRRKYSKLPRVQPPNCLVQPKKQFKWPAAMENEPPTLDFRSFQVLEGDNRRDEVRFQHVLGRETRERQVKELVRYRCHRAGAPPIGMSPFTAAVGAI